MDTSSLLSGEQLFALKLVYQEEKRTKPKVPGRISKLNEIPESSVERIKKEVNQILDDHCDLLRRPRLRLFRDMGSADWCTGSRSAVVRDPRRKPQWMGSNSSGQLTYSPEETVFLMETEQLRVQFKGLPMSLQDAYQLILAGSHLINPYKAFSLFARLGFKLQSCPPQEASVQSQAHQSKGENISHQSKRVRGSPTDFISSSYEPSGQKIDLKVKPLLREMFLNDTDLEKVANWSEHSRRIQPRVPPDAILEEEATVLELDDQIKSTNNIFDQLPNRSLVDRAKNLKPLVDQTKIIGIDRIHQIIAEAGPQETDLHSLLPASKTQPDIKYRVFKPETANLKNPHFHLVMCKDQTPPMVQEVMRVSEKCKGTVPIFAVITQTDVLTYTLEPFEVPRLIPTYWDKTLSPT